MDAANDHQFTDEDFARLYQLDTTWLDSDLTYASVRQRHQMPLHRMRYFREEGRITGYCCFRATEELVHIAWFVAPKNGRLYLQEFLADYTVTCRKKVTLLVEIDKDTPPKATGARLALYLSAGFAITSSYSTAESTGIQMERLQDTG